MTWVIVIALDLAYLAAAIYIVKYVFGYSKGV